MLPSRSVPSVGVGRRTSATTLMTDVKVNKDASLLQKHTFGQTGVSSQRLRGFARFFSKFQAALLGAMYFMNKGSTKTNANWVYLLFILSVLQLLSFPLSPVFWRDSQLLSGFSDALSLLSVRVETLVNFIPEAISVWVFFFAGLIWISFILALATYAGISSARGRWYVIWPLKALRMTSRLTDKALIIPLVNSILGILRCRGGMIGGWQCWSVFHIFWSVIMLIILTCFILFYLVVVAVFFPRSSSPGGGGTEEDPSAQLHGRSALATFILKILLSILGTFSVDRATSISDEAHSLWYIRALYLLAFSLLAYMNLRYMAYESRTMNAVQTSADVLLVWAAAITASKPAIGDPLTTDVVLLMGAPLAIFIGGRLAYARMESVVRMSVDSVRDALVVEMKARLLHKKLARRLAVVLNGEENGAAPDGMRAGRLGLSRLLTSMGLAGATPYSSVVQGVPESNVLGRLGPTGDSERCFDEVEVVYRRAMEVLPTSATIHVMFAGYLCSHGGGLQRQRELVQLAAAERKDPPLDMWLLAAQRKKQIEDEESGAMSALGLGGEDDRAALHGAAALLGDSRGPTIISGHFSVIQRATYDKHVQDCLRESRLARSTLASMWGTLLEPVPSLDKLHTLGNALGDACVKADQAFMQAQSLNPRDVFLLRKYASFLAEVLQDEARAEGIVKELEELEGTASKARNAIRSVTLTLMTPADAVPPAVQGGRGEVEGDPESDASGTKPTLASFDLANPALAIIPLDVEPSSLLPLLLGEPQPALRRMTGLSAASLLNIPLPALFARPTNVLMASMMRTYMGDGEVMAALLGQPTTTLVQTKAGHAAPALFAMQLGTDGLTALVQPSTPAEDEGVLVFVVSATLQNIVTTQSRQGVGSTPLLKSWRTAARGGKSSHDSGVSSADEENHPFLGISVPSTPLQAAIASRPGAPVLARGPSLPAIGIPGRADKSSDKQPRRSSLRTGIDSKDFSPEPRPIFQPNFSPKLLARQSSNYQIPDIAPLRIVSASGELGYISSSMTSTDGFTPGQAGPEGDSNINAMEIACLLTAADAHSCRAMGISSGRVPRSAAAALDGTVSGLQYLRTGRPSAAASRKPGALQSIAPGAQRAQAAVDLTMFLGPELLDGVLAVSTEALLQADADSEAAAAAGGRKNGPGAEALQAALQGVLGSWNKGNVSRQASGPWGRVTTLGRRIKTRVRDASGKQNTVMTATLQAVHTESEARASSLCTNPTAKRFLNSAGSGQASAFHRARGGTGSDGVPGGVHGSDTEGAWTGSDDGQGRRPFGANRASAAADNQTAALAAALSYAAHPCTFYVLHWKKQEYKRAARPIGAVSPLNGLTSSKVPGRPPSPEPHTPSRRYGEQVTSAPDDVRSPPTPSAPISASPKVGPSRMINLTPRLGAQAPHKQDSVVPALDLQRSESSRSVGTVPPPPRAKSQSQRLSAGPESSNRSRKARSEEPGQPRSALKRVGSARALASSAHRRPDGASGRSSHSKREHPRSASGRPRSNTAEHSNGTAALEMTGASRVDSRSSGLLADSSRLHAGSRLQLSKLRRAISDVSGLGDSAGGALSEGAQPALAGLRRAFLLLFSVAGIMLAIHFMVHLVLFAQYSRGLGLQAVAGRCRTLLESVHIDLQSLLLVEGGYMSFSSSYVPGAGASRNLQQSVAPQVAVLRWADVATSGDPSGTIAALYLAAPQGTKQWLAPTEVEQVLWGAEESGMNTVAAGHDAMLSHLLACSMALKEVVSRLEQGSRSILTSSGHAQLWHEGLRLNLVRLDSVPGTTRNATDNGFAWRDREAGVAGLGQQAQLAPVLYQSTLLEALLSYQQALEQVIAGYNADTASSSSIPFTGSSSVPLSWLLLNSEALHQGMDGALLAMKNSVEQAWVGLTEVAASIALMQALCIDIILLAVLAPAILAVETSRDRVLRAFLHIDVRAVRLLYQQAESGRLKELRDMKGNAADLDTDLELEAVGGADFDLDLELLLAGGSAADAPMGAELEPGQPLQHAGSAHRINATYSPHNSEVNDGLRRMDILPVGNSIGLGNVGPQGQSMGVTFAWMDALRPVQEEGSSATDHASTPRSRAAARVLVSPTASLVGGEGHGSVLSLGHPQTLPALRKEGSSGRQEAPPVPSGSTLQVSSRLDTATAGLASLLLGPYDGLQASPGFTAPAGASAALNRFLPDSARSKVPPVAPAMLHAASAPASQSAPSVSVLHPSDARASPADRAPPLPLKHMPSREVGQPSYLSLNSAKIHPVPAPSAISARAPQASINVAAPPVLPAGGSHADSSGGSGSFGTPSGGASLRYARERKYAKSNRAFFALLFRFAGPLLLLVGVVAGLYGYTVQQVDSIKWAHHQLHMAVAREVLQKQVFTAARYALVGGSPHSLLASDLASAGAAATRIPGPLGRSRWAGGTESMQQISADMAQQVPTNAIFRGLQYSYWGPRGSGNASLSPLLPVSRGATVQAHIAAMRGADIPPAPYGARALEHALNDLMHVHGAAMSGTKPWRETMRAVLDTMTGTPGGSRPTLGATALMWQELAAQMQDEGHKHSVRMPAGGFSSDDVMLMNSHVEVSAILYSEDVARVGTGSQGVPGEIVRPRLQGFSTGGSESNSAEGGGTGSEWLQPAAEEARIRSLRSLMLVDGCSSPATAGGQDLSLAHPWASLIGQWKGPGAEAALDALVIQLSPLSVPSAAPNVTILAPSAVSSLCTAFDGGLMLSGAHAALSALPGRALTLASRVTQPALFIPGGSAGAGACNASAGGQALGEDTRKACAVFASAEYARFEALALAFLPRALRTATATHLAYAHTLRDNFYQSHLGVLLATLGGLVAFYLLVYSPSIAAVEADTARSVRLLLLLPPATIDASPAVFKLVYGVTKHLQMLRAKGGAS